MSVLPLSPSSQFLGGQFLGAHSNQVTRRNLSFKNPLEEDLNGTAKCHYTYYTNKKCTGKNILTLFLVSLRLNIKLLYLFLYLLSVSLYK